MGAAITELNIYSVKEDAVALAFSRKLPFSGDTVTKSMTETLTSDRGKVELSLKEAERIKREHGIPRPENPQLIDGKISTHEVLSLIRPKVEQFAGDIGRSFDFYREESGGRLSRCRLSSGGNTPLSR